MLTGPGQQRSRRAGAFVALTLLAATCWPSEAAAQFNRRLSLGRASSILEQIHSELKKHYYDPDFGGVDVEARFREARVEMAGASSDGQLFTAIARYLLALDDSHTFFFPPTSTAIVDYGFELRFYGDDCHVVLVKPGTDAEAKGLRPGDRVLALDGFLLERSTFGALDYMYRVVAPRSFLPLIVETPQGERRHLRVDAHVQYGPESFDVGSVLAAQRLDRRLDSLSNVLAHVSVTVADSVLLWKMPAFLTRDRNLGKLVDRGRNHAVLILDLRGNGGGSVATLAELSGAFLEGEPLIGTMRGRSRSEEVKAKRHKEPFLGRMIVLVDSESASAAEIFARLMQIRGRALVVGDRTAGAVMASKHFGGEVGAGRRWFYGLSITTHDFVLPNEERLEKAGVVPDLVVTPSPTDLARRADPVLARALALAGANLSAEEAAELGGRKP